MRRLLYLLPLLLFFLAAPVHAATPTLVHSSYCPVTDSPAFGNPGTILTDICPASDGGTLSGNTVYVMVTCSVVTDCGVPTDDKSTVYTQVETINDSTNATTTQLYCGKPSAGMQLVTANPVAGGAGHTQIFWSEYNNVGCTVDVHNHSNSASNTSISGGSATPTNTGDLLIMLLTCTTNVGTSFTAGSNSNITWNFGAEASFAYGAWQWGQDSSNVAINPSMNVNNSGGSQTYNAVWAAFTTSASGTALPAGLHIIQQLHHNSPTPTPLTSTVKIPTYGNFIVMWHSVLAGCNITSMSSSPSLTWTKTGEAGNNVPVGSQQYIEFWTAKNTSPSTAMTATMVINAGCTAAQNIYTATFDDIIGADPNNPLCSTWGSSGFASATGDQTSGGNAVTTFTATPCGANNIIIVGGSLNLDSALAWTSPGCAAFTQARYTSNNGTWTNGYAIPSMSDENDPNGVCLNGSTLTAQTWIFPHTTDDGTFAGFWAVAGVDVVPAAVGVSGAAVQGNAKIQGNATVI